MAELLQKKNNLVHCIFASSVQTDLDEAALTEALVHQRGKSITGLSLYESGHCFQVIEGDRDEVELLYRSFCQDRAHQKMVKIIEEPINQRSFQDWTTAYGEAIKRSFKQMKAQSDYFAAEGPFRYVANGRAKRLVRQFISGKWRL